MFRPVTQQSGWVPAGNWPPQAHHLLHNHGAAAVKTGRHSIGVEVEPEYLRIVHARLARQPLFTEQRIEWPELPREVAV